jgi:dsRNA-specific ribonuclease
MMACRLLRESGRTSNSPIYVVGIFSGIDKLGEGFGSSLKMAEYRVCHFYPYISILVYTF